MQDRDWLAWHRAYQDEGSPLSERLVLVQRCIREALDEHASGPWAVVSICAGQGHDLIGALADHPRRHDVRGRLVELDPRNVEVARAQIDAADLPEVEVLCADASVSDSYLGAVPADLVLLCGVLGNIAVDGAVDTIRRLPELCADGARVIWTRHRRPPDQSPTIQEAFREQGFADVSVEQTESFTVGACRLVAPSRPLEAGVRLFEFVGYDNL